MDDTSKYFQILLKQQSHNIAEIEEAYKYMKLNFMQIYTDTKLYQLDKETFKNLLVSDQLNVESEELVFECVKKYLEQNTLNPTEHLYDLILLVRLPLVSVNYLMDVVEPVVNSDFSSRPLFLEALRYHFFPDERNKIPSYRTTPRNISHNSNNANDMILLIGSCYEKDSGILEVYSRSRNEWKVYKDYNLSIRNFAVAEIDNRLMLVGGYNMSTKAATSAVFSIDLKTGVLSSEQSLREIKYNVGVAVVGKGKSANLFAIGGAAPGNYRNTVERWDPVSRQWSLMSPMPFARDCCAVVVFDEKIYVTGGMGAQSYKSMDMYDPKTNTWTHIGNANTVGGYCSAVATKEYIYLVGGYPKGWRGERNSTMERYHPKTNTWSIVSSITANGVRALVNVGDKIITAGGFHNDRNVEEFDIATQQWKNLAVPLHGREYCTLVKAYLEDADEFRVDER